MKIKALKKSVSLILTLAMILSASYAISNFSAYATGNETEVQKQFMDMIAGATNMSGTPINDMGTSEFKTQCEDKTQELSIGSVSVEEYLTSLEEECAR